MNSHSAVRTYTLKLARIREVYSKKDLHSDGSSRWTRAFSDEYDDNQAIGELRKFYGFPRSLKTIDSKCEYESTVSRTLLYDDCEITVTAFYGRGVVDKGVK